jgi:RimJ/RimL family protein N-acetyltransferase
MITPSPVVLEGRGVRLEPLGQEHREALAAALGDGELWRLWFTTTPEPGKVGEYIDEALAGLAAGRMLPWAVRELGSGTIVGSTRYQDILVPASRVEIGHTWYAKSWQRTHVNTACKLLLLGHAFDTLGAGVVGLRTDGFNFTSQRAIEALGAKKDGVIRQFGVRKDGSVRDTVMYSILAGEWPDVRRNLEFRMSRRA